MYSVTTSSKNKCSNMQDISLPDEHKKPASLEKLLNITRFSRDELKSLYRSFKQACPVGLIDKQTFATIYGNFFLPGAKRDYAKMVFRTLDKKNSGSLTFEEFAMALSELSRGSIEVKLGFIFSLYDANSDGYISHDEVANVAKAVFGLVGPYSSRITDSRASDYEESIDVKARSVIERFDMDKDGRISKDEFFERFYKDAELMRSLGYFDTYI